MPESKDEVYHMTAEQADIAMGMLMKTIKEQQEQINRVEAESFGRWQVIDMKNRIK